MIADGYVYNILLVSAAQNLNASLCELLRGSFGARVETVGDVSSAKRAFAEQAYDFVIINAPLPDGPGVRFAIDVSTAGETVALVFVRADIFDEITERVSNHGVLTLSKPVSRAMTETALRWMISIRARLHKAKAKTQTLEEKMSEIRLVNRAKWLLIEKKGMDEPTAHRFLEKQAMDRCMTRRELAQEIIQAYA